ncbi:MAG: RNA polymerase sigma factor [Acidobacteriota bacterium]
MRAAGSCAVSIAPTAERVPDGELAARILAGEEEAFDCLYLRYRSLVFSTALRLVGSREDAEDVASEVFWRVFTRIATYDSRRPFLPWIYRIAMRESFSLLRRRRARGRHSGPMPLPEPAAECRIEEIASIRQFASRAESIIRRLPAGQAKAILLHDVADHAAAVLSRSLAVPLPTFKSRLRRARRAVRAKLENPFVASKVRERSL